MSVTYEISRYSGLTLMERETRKRSDAAHDKLWDAIYSTIEANGLLDRPVAWRLRLRREALDATVSPPPMGHCRYQRFLLDPKETLSGYVELRIDRD